VYNIDKIKKEGLFMKINSTNNTVFTKGEIKKLLKFRMFFHDKIWDTILEEGQETSEMGEFFGDLYEKLESIFDYIPKTVEYDNLLEEIEEEIFG
jgi:hypothetical protein